MSPFIHRKTKRRLTQFALLVLVLWSGPVPVGHSHADYASRVSGNQMTAHLQHCHGGFACSESWPTDWHWHWVSLADGYVGLGSEDVLVQAESMVAGQCQRVNQPMWLCYLETRTLKQTFLLPSPCTNWAHSFQNVALLNSRQSLPELLGIIRC